MSFATTRLDRFRELCDEFYYPVRVTAPRGAEFAASVDVMRLGPITVGELRYSAETTIVAGDLHAYHVNMPLSGRFDNEHRGKRFVAHPRRACVYRPEGSTRIHSWDNNGRLLAVKIDRSAVEAQLAALLDRPLRGSLNMGNHIDLATGAGQSWARLAILVRDEFHNGGSVVGHPLIAGQFTQSLIRGLLLATEHRYRDELDQPAPPSRPRTVKRAMEAIDANPAHGFTCGELAEIAGASVRSLQEGFRRHLGQSPMAYLQSVRLAQAHEDLRRARPGETTVADVAHRWGWGHLGRFAAAYRAKYDVPPSTTLRMGSGHSPGS
ncbi:AraC family transcriptional regulator [Polymorphospora sp. NPDC051019]|uniref:AraC family transcriptional regulator n=1 Tax=Polymorphospora sp. NPDC051019 TaxID=3155725 RepID=UPI0034236707